jgi:hypothetical protein
LLILIGSLYRRVGINFSGADFQIRARNYLTTGTNDAAVQGLCANFEKVPATELPKQIVFREHAHHLTSTVSATVSRYRLDSRFSMHVSAGTVTDFSGTRPLMSIQLVSATDDAAVVSKNWTSLLRHIQTLSSSLK